MALLQECLIIYTTFNTRRIISNIIEVVSTSPTTIYKSSLSVSTKYKIYFEYHCMIQERDILFTFLGKSFSL